MVNKVRSIPFVFRKQQFATDVRAARADYNFSQAEVARHLRVTGAWVSTIENAQEENPKILNFLDMCNLFDLDPRNYWELGE